MGFAALQEVWRIYTNSYDSKRLTLKYAGVIYYVYEFFTHSIWSSGICWYKEENNSSKKTNYPATGAKIKWLMLYHLMTS